MIIRGTFKGKPRSVVAGRVSVVEENDDGRSKIYLDHSMDDGRIAFVFFDEPLEVVEGALCEALQYARRDRN